MSVELKFTFASVAEAAAFLMLAGANAPAQLAQAPSPAKAPTPAAKAPAATPAPTPAPTAAPAAPGFEYAKLQKAVFALAAKDKGAVLELAKSFGVTTFKDLPAEKWEAAHAAVVAKTEELAVA